MTYLPAHRLTPVVALICAEIATRVECNQSAPSERKLWWELSCCLLSSRVPYRLAVAAADAVDRSEVLRQPCSDAGRLARELEEVLSRPMPIASGQSRAYRFPSTRARQLALTRVAVAKAAGELGHLLASFDGAEVGRRWFVLNAPGIGPKQASMFLRNIGYTFELAILDRHVLSYMAAHGFVDARTTSVSGLPDYLRHERRLRSHAYELGYALGHLDWAIWIVMRAARVMEKEDSVP